MPTNIEASIIIEQIKSDTLESNQIVLDSLSLNNDDISAIMTAAQQHREAAKKITYIDISDNDITEIFIPNTLCNLQGFNANSNKLSSLTISEHLTKLQYLFLNNNNLQTLNIHKNCNSLIVISANNNQLKSFTIDDYWIHLQKLHLRNNLLEAIVIPSTLLKLKQIFIEDNNITSFVIPDTLTALTDIYIDNNKLSLLALPSWVDSSLEEFIVDCNQLTIISQLRLSTFGANNPNCNIRGDNQNSTQDLINLENLCSHFEELLKIIIKINIAQPICNTLAKNNELTYDINQLFVNLHLKNEIAHEIFLLKSTFPEQVGMIEQCEKSIRFNLIRSEYSNYLDNIVANELASKSTSTNNPMLLRAYSSSGSVANTSDVLQHTSKFKY